MRRFISKYPVLVFVLLTLGYQFGVVGIVKGEIVFTPHAEAIVQKKAIEPDLFRLLHMLAV